MRANPSKWTILGKVDAEDEPVNGHCHHCGTLIKHAVVLDPVAGGELFYVGVCCAALLMGTSEARIKKQVEKKQQEAVQIDLEAIRDRAMASPMWPGVRAHTKQWFWGYEGRPGVRSDPESMRSHLAWVRRFQREVGFTDQEVFVVFRWMAYDDAKAALFIQTMLASGA